MTYLVPDEIFIDFHYTLLPAKCFNSLTSTLSSNQVSREGSEPFEVWPDSAL